MTVLSHHGRSSSFQRKANRPGWAPAGQEAGRAHGDVVPVNGLTDGRSWRDSPPTALTVPAALAGKLRERAVVLGSQLKMMWVFTNQEPRNDTEGEGSFWCFSGLPRAPSSQPGLLKASKVACPPALRELLGADRAETQPAAGQHREARSWAAPPGLSPGSL